MHVYTHASITDIIARKSARFVQVGGHVGEDRRACPARGKLNREVAGYADSARTAAGLLPREDPRAEVGEDVRVGVGPVEFQLYKTTARYIVRGNTISPVTRLLHAGANGRLHKLMSGFNGLPRMVSLL